MLNAVCSPLVLRDLAEDGGTLIEELLDNTVLRVILKVFEGVLKGSDDELASRVEDRKDARYLNDERPSLMTSESSPLSLEGSVDAMIEELSIRCVVSKLRRITYNAKIGGAGAVQVSSMIYHDAATLAFPINVETKSAYTLLQT